MFSSVRNDVIIQDLSRLAQELKKLNDDAQKANSATIGKFTTQLRDQLSKVHDHVKEMVSAAIKYDEVKDADVQDV